MNKMLLKTLSPTLTIFGVIWRVTFAFGDGWASPAMWFIFAGAAAGFGYHLLNDTMGKILPIASLVFIILWLGTVVALGSDSVCTELDCQTLSFIGFLVFGGLGYSLLFLSLPTKSFNLPSKEDKSDQHIQN